MTHQFLSLPLVDVRKVTFQLSELPVILMVFELLWSTPLQSAYLLISHKLMGQLELVLEVEKKSDIPLGFMTTSGLKVLKQ